MPSSDLSTNLSLVADMIHKGTARIMVIGDSQQSLGNFRVSTGMLRQWAPEKGWAGRYIYGGGAGGGGDSVAGFWSLVGDAGGHTVAEPNLTRDMGEVNHVLPANLAPSFGADWLWVTDSANGQTFGRWYLVDNGSNMTYGGNDPHWARDHAHIARVIYNKSATAAPLADWKQAPVRYNGTTQALGAFASESIDAGVAGIYATQIPIPQIVGGGAGGAGVMLTTSPTLDESVGPANLFVLGTQIFQDNGLGTGPKADGLSFVASLGRGGANLIDHLDPARANNAGEYIDTGPRGIISKGFYPPNIVMIHVTNLFQTAGVDKEDDGAGGLDVAVWGGHLDELITRIEGWFAAEGLPIPMFMLIVPWVTTGGIGAGHTADMRDEMYSRAVASVENAGHSVINFHDGYGGAMPAFLAGGDEVHPESVSEADQLASFMWDQITEKSRDVLNTNLATYWKCEEGSGNRNDDLEFANTLANSTTVGSTSGLFPGTLAPLFDASTTEHLDALRTLGNTKNLNPLPATDFSCSCWYKSTGGAGVLEGPCGLHAANAGWRFLKLSTDVLQVQFSTGADSVVNSGVAWVPGKWHHLVFAHKHGVGQTFWVDGVPATAFDTGQMTSALANFNVGGTFGSYVTGSVCQIGFWQGRALVQTDVNRLFRGDQGLPLSEFGKKNNMPAILAALEN